MELYTNKGAGGVDMHLLAEQQYFKVQREVTSIGQEDIEYERTLYLYNDRIVTHRREFAIQDVIDISYRQFGQEAGLLYIHTESGLFTYTVKTSARTFIEAFKNKREESK